MNGLGAGKVRRPADAQQFLYDLDWRNPGDPAKAVSLILKALCATPKPNGSHIQWLLPGGLIFLQGTNIGDRHAIRNDLARLKRFLVSLDSADAKPDYSRVSVDLVNRDRPVGNS